MDTAPKWSWWMVPSVLLVLATAAGTRSWYLLECGNGGHGVAAIKVQGKSPHLDGLVARFGEERELRGGAPLTRSEELTAHQAPGFVLLRGLLAATLESGDMVLRWLHVVLGTLTVGCYCLFARRAFHHTLIAFIAGLLAAVHPFWVLNTAELTDGVLVSFLLSVCLLLGTRGMQQGGGFTGLLFGLFLATLVMVRAALLPFALLALLAFLWQCRKAPAGWFVGFTALIGFINCVAPWSLRNYQAFERPIPIADSTYLHLWMGNNPHATGSALPDDVLRASLAERLGDDKVTELLDEPNQAIRYQRLAVPVWQEVKDHPQDTITRRIQAGLTFLLGERWFTPHRSMSQHAASEAVAPAPEWLKAHVESILQGTLLALGVLALLGWRWSAPWRRPGRLATVALLWIPVPYVLTHAEHLAGPRLPLDGVLLCYAAFALVSLIPGLVRAPEAKKEDATH
jgi:4-amino-4-deoxy-L-arabinose transferase-like glycosyltransferase